MSTNNISPTFKLIICASQCPLRRDMDSAFKDRLRVIPFASYSSFSSDEIDIPDTSLEPVSKKRKLQD